MDLFSALSLLVVACSRDDEPRAPADAIPEATSPISGNVTLGTVASRGRDNVSVGAVKLARTPITVRDYRRCVESGFCAVPARNDVSCAAKGIDGQTWTDAPERREMLPVTCTTATQAAKYCRWVGGRLPRLDEWLLAARGSEVHRYPWGDAAPTCEQSMRLQYRSTDTAGSCGASVLGDDMSVGTHPKGHGAGVLDDVLASRGEYVSGVKSSTFAGCDEGTTCAIRGGAPGAIEQIVPANAAADLEASAFRCAWSQ